MMKKWLNLIKPWIGVIALIVLLRYTGILGGISYYTQSALLQTGLMDASAQSDATPELFDYGFKIRDLQGNEIDFSSRKGKVILLNLWATWCGPCRAEMPTIQKLYNKIGQHENIEFVMLSLDKNNDRSKVVKYISDHQYSFPTYLPSGYLAEQLQVPSIPTTFIISKDGKILIKEVGTTNFNTRKFEKFLIAEAEK